MVENGLWLLDKDVVTSYLFLDLEICIFLLVPSFVEKGFIRKRDVDAIFIRDNGDNILNEYLEDIKSSFETFFPLGFMNFWKCYFSWNANCVLKKKDCSCIKWW